MSNEPSTKLEAGQEPEEFYAKHQKVYPRKVTGLFASLRVTGVLVLLGIYYFVPWMRWDGHQAVLFDLPARKFYIFGLTFWPQDFFYLAALLIIAALSLFFFTALAGRLWCGYACPQTVWTEAFLWIERKIEGDRNKQMKLANEPWSLRKLRIR
ncbi:MAG: 4Fe-4S binding protein, partial [Thioalkalispiraceae bacterium]